jgi:hypothetical protein
MIKKTIILVLAIGIILGTLSPLMVVQAQGNITILDSPAQADFPLRLIFSLSARSDTAINDIRLHYQINRADFAEVTSEVYVGFAPNTTVDISWPLDMVKTGGLPPGSSLNYWWTIKDARGNSAQTSPSQVQFDDTRYAWLSMTEGKVTIYWYEGKESFAREIMAAAQQALERLLKDTGAHLDDPIKIYIYADARDLQGAMIFPQEWTGGVAFTRYGTIAIGIAPDNLEWGKSATAHELAHLVIHQMTSNPYGDLPTWLDEGLAMYAEGELSPGFAAYLDRAISENNLISVRSLCSPFSAYADKAILSYAQSYSLVDFLITDYGQYKML